MTLRKAHGHAAELGATVVVEVLPADELPAGRPAPASQPIERRPNGAFTSAGAAAAGRLGGKSTQAKRRYAARLADTLGLLKPGDALGPYVAEASRFAEVHRAELANSVGGGFVGPAVASLVQNGALALAASRWAYSEGSRTGDAKKIALGSQLADRSKQALLAAHELCAREAQARAAAAPSATPWLIAGPQAATTALSLDEPIHAGHAPETTESGE